MSLHFAPKSPIDSKSTLVQVMAWHRGGATYCISVKPLLEPMAASFIDAYMRHLVPRGWYWTAISLYYTLFFPRSPFTNMG